MTMKSLLLSIALQYTAKRALHHNLLDPANPFGFKEDRKTI